MGYARLEALGPDGALVVMFGDYAAVRAEVRECMASPGLPDLLG